MIGFKQDNYTFSERVDSLNSVIVELISGQLGQEVMVTLNTESASTTGQFFQKPMSRLKVGERSV